METKYFKDNFKFKEFWTQGGFILRVAENKHYLDLQDFILTKQKYNLNHNETIPVLTADWDTPVFKKENPPSIYKDFVKEILQQKCLKQYQDIYGNFTHTKLMLHKTPKGYINDFHSHTYDGTHLHILFHFTDSIRIIEDGGLIQVGEVIDKGNVIFNDIDFYHRNPRYHKPNISEVVSTGMATIINNINPYFRHAVTEVLSDKSRYTLMLACGYKDNQQKRDIQHI